MKNDTALQRFKKENPFLSEPELLFRYIELTLKKYYSDEVFAFLKEQMAIRAEKAWKERFKAMKKELGWFYDDMAKFMGAKSGASLKASISRKLPAFAKLAICIFEEIKDKQNPKD